MKIVTVTDTVTDSLPHDTASSGVTEDTGLPLKNA